MSAPTPEVVPSAIRDGGAAAVRRITWYGLAANLILSAFKLIAGLIGTSQAVVADAVHSLSDCSTDVAILIGVKYWSAPADECHPHGHRRIETVVTVFIGAALAGAALLLGYGALATVKDRHESHPRWVALAAALISIAGKELMYRWTIAVGKREKSPAVIANAWHHRSDAFSSIPVAIAVGVSLLNPLWASLDHVGAVVVSLFILRAAWGIMRPAFGELVDAGAPREVRDRVEEIARDTAGVEEVHKIRTRYVGTRLQVDLHVTVRGDMTVREGHDISEKVKRRLIAYGPEVIDVVVHLEPHDGE